VTYDELLFRLQQIKNENPAVGGLPIVLKDSMNAEHEAVLVDVEVPYTGIGRWVVID